MRITYELITPEVFVVKDDSATITQRIKEQNKNTIRVFKDYLITVLEERRKALFTNFIRHTEDVTFDDGEFAEYIRKDKTYGVFIKSEFQDMEAGIELLQNEAIEDFLGCKTILRQCIMGIPFVERPEDMSGKPKFSDLMRVLTM